MYFHHCLQQELDNFWMNVATYQYLRGRSNELHVIGWNVSRNINHTLWQYQLSELGKNTGKSLRHRQTHNANVRISKQGFVRPKLGCRFLPVQRQCVFLQVATTGQTVHSRSKRSKMDCCI